MNNMHANPRMSVAFLVFSPSKGLVEREIGRLHPDGKPHARYERFNASTQVVMRDGDMPSEDPTPTYIYPIFIFDVRGQTSTIAHRRFLQQKLDALAEQFPQATFADYELWLENAINLNERYDLQDFDSNEGEPTLRPLDVFNHVEKIQHDLKFLLTLYTLYQREKQSKGDSYQPYWEDLGNKAKEELKRQESKERKRDSSTSPKASSLRHSAPHGCLDHDEQALGQSRWNESSSPFQPSSPLISLRTNSTSPSLRYSAPKGLLIVVDFTKEPEKQLQSARDFIKRSGGIVAAQQDFGEVKIAFVNTDSVQANTFPRDQFTKLVGDNGPCKEYSGDIPAGDLQGSEAPVHHLCDNSIRVERTPSPNSSSRISHSK